MFPRAFRLLEGDMLHEKIQLSLLVERESSFFREQSQEMSARAVNILKRKKWTI